MTSQSWYCNTPISCLQLNSILDTFGFNDTAQLTACLHHEAGLIIGIGAGLLLF